jgi:hypothetical protein
MTVALLDNLEICFKALQQGAKRSLHQIWLNELGGSLSQLGGTET